MSIRFKGEISASPAGTGQEFKIEVTLEGIPTQAQASELGRFVHEALESYMRGKGAKLVRSVGGPPGELRPSKLVLQS